MCLAVPRHEPNAAALTPMRTTRRDGVKSQARTVRGIEKLKQIYHTCQQPLAIEPSTETLKKH